MKYSTVMGQAFMEAKRQGIGIVSEIYDRDGMTRSSQRKCNKELAKFNLVFRTWSGKGFWKNRGSVVALDPKNRVPHNWRVIADTYVFEAGGGC